MLTLNLGRHKAVHSDQLERWLGAAQVDRLSKTMLVPGGTPWQGTPIAVHGVPGAVYVGRDGDFAGKLRAGFESTWQDRAAGVVKRLERGLRRGAWRSAHELKLHTGFASLSDLISEATTGGKKQTLLFAKTGSTGVTSITNTLWRVGPTPAAGGAGSAAPGGRAPVKSTTGAFPDLRNASGSDTLHFVGGAAGCEDANNTLLLYDRIFDVAKTMSSTTAESVTGVPTRYQSSTATDADFAGNNFIFIEVVTALGATAHNWTVVQYRNQAGTDAQSAPSMVGAASAIQDRLDHPTNQWFMPLATGDWGAKDLHQIQCDASVTGAINFCLGHPIAFFPIVAAGLMCEVDGINTAFNLERIFDDACLSFLEMPKPSTSSTSYFGQLRLVSG